MIQPVNGHLLIEPVKHESFMQSEKQTYEEIGIVRSVSGEMWVKVPNNKGDYTYAVDIALGDKVYFDSWLAARYPKEGGGPDDFYWLVKWEDVRAIEHVEPKIPE